MVMKTLPLSYSFSVFFYTEIYLPRAFSLHYTLMLFIWKLEKNANKFEFNESAIDLGRHDVIFTIYRDLP